MLAKPERSAWTYASGRSAVLHSRMAAAGVFGRLIKARRPGEIPSLLGDTFMAEAFAGGEDLQEADRLIGRTYREMIEELREVSPAPAVADLVLMRRELRSLKNHLKREQLGMEVSRGPSRFGEEVWERLWRDLPVQGVPPLFAAVLKRTRGAVEVDPERPELFDAAFDAASLRELREAARATGSPFVAGYWERYDTVKGVESLWRARAQGLGEEVRGLLVRWRARGELFKELRRSEEETWPALLASFIDGLEVEAAARAEGPARIAAFVAAADRWLMYYVREARLVAFGPEPVFGAVVGLEAEAHNMRMAVVGRANGVAPERLDSHLRAVYASGS